MSLERAKLNEVVAVLNSLLGKNLAILTGEPKLSPWVKDLEEHRTILLALMPSAAPQAPVSAPSVELSPAWADRRNEAAARCFRHMVQAQVQFALARGDVALAARWEALEGQTLSEGLRFLKQTQRAQVGGAQRCLAATEHESVTAALSSPPLAMDFKATLGLLKETTDALQQALDAEAVLESDEEPPPTPQALQRKARSTIRTVLEVARKVLDKEELEKLEEALPR